MNPNALSPRADPVSPEDNCASSLARDGFVFVPGSAMRTRLAAVGSLSDWDSFAASWNDLAVDTYMADHGRYRRRRHAVYKTGADGVIRRDTHQPHYQAPEYNTLNGGIERWFEPILPAAGDSASLAAILRFCRNLFSRRAPSVKNWHIEAHQFRIEARAGRPGLPTPEGMHRDGVDYVLVLLIERRNIQSGTTVINDLDGRALGSFTLVRPFDAALVEDRRVQHGVTPVEPVDPAQEAWRDVLVLTFRNQDSRVSKTSK